MELGWGKMRAKKEQRKIGREIGSEESRDSQASHRCSIY